MRPAPHEDAPAGGGRRSGSAGELAREPRRASGPAASCRSVATNAAWSIWRSRNATLAYQSRFSEGTTANYVALETLRAVLQLPSLPRRIECFDISTIQGAETVASMVVCEDGRMKRSEYRKFRVRRARGIRFAERRAGTRFLDDFAAMRQVVERRYRRVLEAGGPFPDLIVIDGGKGQLGGRVRGARRHRSARIWWRSVSRSGRSCCSLRDRADPIALADAGSGAAAAPADSRRGAPVCGDVPPEGTVDARPAVGARPRSRCRAPPPPRRCCTSSAALPASAAQRGRNWCRRLVQKWRMRCSCISAASDLRASTVFA